AFSTVLAKLLESALPRQTSRLCQAVITPVRFPDLGVYLFLSGSPAQGDAGRSLCAPALQKLVLQLQPTRDMINKIASEGASSTRRLYSNPPGLWLEATDDLRIALA